MLMSKEFTEIEINLLQGWGKKINRLYNGETAQSCDRFPKTVCRSVHWRTEEERVSPGEDGEERSGPTWRKNSWETTQEEVPGERGEGKKQKRSWRTSKQTDRKRRAGVKASRVGSQLEWVKREEKYGKYGNAHKEGETQRER